MATWCDLPLPEISVEDFTRAWIRFELVQYYICCERMECREVSINRADFVARETGGLYYVEIDATTKADLKQLKTALMRKAGLTQDPLTAGKLFISRFQR